MDSFVTFEAFISGIGIIATEIYIIARHCQQSRSLWYYYPIPIAHGTWLILASFYPSNLFINLTATLFASVTTLNSHNTFVPHTLAVRHHMIFDVSDPQLLIQDLYAHRYQKEFKPFGLVLQFLYALMCIFHVSIRSWALASFLQ